MAFSIVGHVVWPLFSAPHSGRYLGTRVLSLTVEEEEEAALAEHENSKRKENEKCPLKVLTDSFKHNGASMMSVGNRKCCKSS